MLVGGLRVLGANHGGSPHGVFTDRPGTLTNDFFVNLLDMGTKWTPTSPDEVDVRGPRPGDRRAALDRHPRRPRLRLATRSSARSPRSTRRPTHGEKFVRDFVAAWTKVMNADRFDLA